MGWPRSAPIHPPVTVSMDLSWGRYPLSCNLCGEGSASQKLSFQKEKFPREFIQIDQRILKYSIFIASLTLSALPRHIQFHITSFIYDGTWLMPIFKTQIDKNCVKRKWEMTWVLQERCKRIRILAGKGLPTSGAVPTLYPCLGLLFKLWYWKCKNSL